MSRRLNCFFGEVLNLILQTGWHASKALAELIEARRMHTEATALLFDGIQHGVEI